MTATLDDVVTELKAIKRLLRGSYVEIDTANKELNKGD